MAVVKVYATTKNRAELHVVSVEREYPSDAWNIARLRACGALATWNDVVEIRMEEVDA